MLGMSRRIPRAYAVLPIWGSYVGRVETAQTAVFPGAIRVVDIAVVERPESVAVTMNDKQRIKMDHITR